VTRYAGPPMSALVMPLAATATATETETVTKTLIGRPWHVIVHDDPVTLMEYVTKVFMEVFAYPQAKAQELMLEVHQTGRSVVWTGARETAESHVQKLQARHLIATLEPSPG
jgi:ATP-dependent Clp protease adaptor protein ClpS